MHIYILIMKFAFRYLQSACIILNIFMYCCSMYKSTSGVVDSIGTSPRCEMMVTRYDKKKKTNTKQEWRHSLHAIFVIRG